MLQYRDGYNYGQCGTSYCIDDQLEQLRSLLLDGYNDYALYQRIRSYCFKEIKVNELAVTVILTDLETIRKKSVRASEVITFFICNSELSYKQIGQVFGVTKQGIYDMLTRWAKEYRWLANLLIMKGNQFCKNENNRTIFFSSGASRNHFLIEEQEGE